ncbi:membrane-bound PQQ-dependent dehydrogenase, glucose/quinate/shikimate family [Pseudomonas sp. NPDC089996]|uniref:membrane-bound PQQ-dependent dehydrogenase, glucose/quinate/shikimate family n=1 Tax=Pseudomonas sp. NPDC089996 TaxID=3364474 RepID=UPI00381296D5
MRFKSVLPIVIGAVLTLLGAGLAFGGAKLISLGGSWYYLLAGLVMAASGITLIKKKIAAAWISLALLVATSIWAFWEVGFDFWQLVPRLITFIVIALVMVLIVPLLEGNRRLMGNPARVVISSALIISLVGFGYGMFRPHPTVVAKKGSSSPVIMPNAGESDGTDWTAYGRNTHGERFAQFDQINKANVKDLQVAWTFRTGDMAINGAEYQGTPLKVNDTVYLCTPLNKVFALDPVTGAEKWKYDPVIQETPSNRTWKRCRGLGYYDVDKAQAAVTNGDEVVDPSVAAQPAECRRRIVMTTVDARLIELDADTGKTCDSFGEHGTVDLLKGIGPNTDGSYSLTSAPLVAGDVIIVGGKINDNLKTGEPSGVTRGFDVGTGEVLWAWEALNPKRGVPLAAGENYPAESPNFWGTASYDPKLGLAYIPTGNQTPDFWNGDRHPGSDEYNDSIVAIDVKTGVDKWHFRTANNDMFDYDVSAQPILYDLPNKQGGTTPVVIAMTKRGQIFVLDRRDGTPVFPVEQRKVATDGVPGMRISPTQPYSKLSVGADRLKESDMWGGTIFDQLMCRIDFKGMRWEGEFTPLVEGQATLIYPGYYGGFNWGGGAVDASTGTLIVNDIRMAQWARFIKQDEAKRIGLVPTTEGEYSEQLGTPWGVERSMFVSHLGVPCFKPPFGTMTAIDLTSGETKWQVPMGSIQDAPVHGIVPGVYMPLGMPTMGGPLVTKGGLTFFHGTLDYYIRALDNDTGEELWRGRLPVGGQGAPMTYVGSDGKQYIVITVGGATRTGSNENRGDYVIAYALPSAAK